MSATSRSGNSVTTVSATSLRALVSPGLRGPKGAESASVTARVFSSVMRHMRSLIAPTSGSGFWMGTQDEEKPPEELIVPPEALPPWALAIKEEDWGAQGTGAAALAALQRAQRERAQRKATRAADAVQDIATASSAATSHGVFGVDISAAAAADPPASASESGDTPMGSFTPGSFSAPPPTPATTAASVDGSSADPPRQSDSDGLVPDPSSSASTARSAAALGGLLAAFAPVHLGLAKYNAQGTLPEMEGKPSGPNAVWHLAHAARGGDLEALRALRDLLRGVRIVLCFLSERITQ